MAHIAEMQAARNAWRILCTSLDLAAGPQPEFYRVVAGQLRLLLCDTTRRHSRVVDISLAARLWPGLCLPALAAEDTFLADGAADLPRLAWLEQALLPDLTIRQLIRQVCDQDGGSHYDPRPHAGLPRPADPGGMLVWVGRVVAVTLEKMLVEG